MRSARNLHDRERAPLGRSQAAPLSGRWSICAFNRPGDGAVALGAAPDLAFRPQGLVAQLTCGRVVIALDLIGKRQLDRIEDACLAAEQVQQPRELFNRAARERSRTQQTLPQQEAHRGRRAVKGNPAGCDRTAARSSAGSEFKLATSSSGIDAAYRLHEV